MDLRDHYSLSPPPPPYTSRARATVFFVVSFVALVLAFVCCLCKTCCADDEATVDARPRPRSPSPRSLPSTHARPQPRPRSPRSRDDGAQFLWAAAAARPLPLPRSPRARDYRAQLPRASDETSSPTVTDRLLAFKYSRPVKPNVPAGGGEEATTCSVCLGAFQLGEMVRLLPVCLHMHHVECINPWLDAHSTCPICRSNTDLAAYVGALPPPPVLI